MCKSDCRSVGNINWPLGELTPFMPASRNVGREAELSTHSF